MKEALSTHAAAGWHPHQLSRVDRCAHYEKPAPRVRAQQRRSRACVKMLSRVAASRTHHRCSPRWSPRRQRLRLRRRLLPQRQLRRPRAPPSLMTARQLDAMHAWTYRSDRVQGRNQSTFAAARLMATRAWGRPAPRRRQRRRALSHDRSRKHRPTAAHEIEECRDRVQKQTALATAATSAAPALARCGAAHLPHTQATRHPCSYCYSSERRRPKARSRHPSPLR